MDYFELPGHWGEDRRHIFVVRDLASGHVLITHSTKEMTASNTVDILRTLFLQEGSPLVLKSDNGASLIADPVEALLKEFGVFPLLSPKAYPQYNGAVEACIHHLKARARYLAARLGRRLRVADVEAARVFANRKARPKGYGGPIPEECWKGRTPIRAEEREAFGQKVGHLLQEHFTGSRPRPVPSFFDVAYARTNSFLPVALSLDTPGRDRQNASATTRKLSRDLAALLARRILTQALTAAGYLEFRT